MNFEELNIDPRCLKILGNQGIVTPTPVQEKAIPVALEGRDLVAIAQTGTGKTLAFGLPALQRLLDQSKDKTRMLVLLPTRELCQQVHDVLQPHARSLGLSIVCVYGGTGMERQSQALRRGANIVVATPGRLMDHMQQGTARLNNVGILVLDEADRMLDMGFMPSIKKILSALPEQRQTMMFSATFPPEIARLTHAMQNNPLRIEVGAIAKPAELVTQKVYTVVKEQKLLLLMKILQQVEVGPTLVFLRTKHATERVSKALARDGFSAVAIHGDLSQNQRTRSIEQFRAGEKQILVATDVAARGLDISGISHVINYDIPATPDDYVHRIGRTARANASGDAITFVSIGESQLLGQIERAIGKQIDRVEWDGSIPIGDTFKPAGKLNRMDPGRRPGLRSFRPSRGAGAPRSRR